MYSRKRAISNGRKISRYYDNISVEGVIEKLENATAPGARRGSKKMLEMMTSREWDLVEGIHTSADATSHIRVSTKRGKRDPGTTWHLRLDRKGVIFDITNGLDERLAGNLPYVAPGA